MPINCEHCHAPCCRHINIVRPDLDRGDGVCKYLSWENRCVIYSCRPDVCNTDKAYERFFARRMTRQEYDQMNEQACALLRSDKL